MSKNNFFLPVGIVILIAAIPLAVLFYQELGTLSIGIRLLIAGGTLAVFVCAWYFVFAYHHLKGRDLLIIGIASALGGCLASRMLGIPQHYISAIGKIILVAWLFCAVALFLIFSCSKLSLFTAAFNKTHLLKHGWVIVVFLVLIIGIAYFQVTRSRTIYTWDYRMYWEWTQTTYNSLHANNWLPTLVNVINSFTADYSQLPVILPALLSLVTGYPTRIHYIFTLTLLYAVPAYILVAYLGKRIWGADSDDSRAWLVATIPILFGFPVFFGTVLHNMVDIGGIILLIAAFLYSDNLLKSITNCNAKYSLQDIIKFSLGLGLFISLMFLYRRWYVFISVGIVFSFISLVLKQLWVRKENFWAVFQRAFIAAVFIAFTAIPLLAFVIFDWSKNLGQHNYVNLYSAWVVPLSEDIKNFIYNFGIVVPALSIGCLFFLRSTGVNRNLLFILIGSSLIAVILFHQVQMFGKHHYYLLMPFFCAPIVGFSIVLYRRFGLTSTVVLSFIFLVSGFSSTHLNQPFGAIALFPSYRDWLPEKLGYIDGYKAIAKWRMLPENNGRKFAVIAADGIADQSRIGEVWQILPDISANPFKDEQIYLGDVDSRDGPPSERIRNCDIAFVRGEPFVFGMKESEQQCIKMIQEDLISGTGIGAAFRKTPLVFVLNQDTKIFIYERIRKITDQEYQDLVRRFLERKGPYYINPKA